MKRLYIGEKPTVAQAIAQHLGISQKGDGIIRGTVDGVETIVTWVFGHMLQMAEPVHYNPRYRKWDVEDLPIAPDDWKLSVTEDRKKQFRIIQHWLNQVDTVRLATDADTEGELIGRELLDVCGYQGPLDRLWIQGLDQASVESAFANILSEEDTVSHYHAGLGRSRADWLVGMNLTRLYTAYARKHGYEGLLPVGRVQAPIARLIVKRCELIENFKPIKFFTLKAKTATKKGGILAKWEPSATEPPAFDEEGRCIDRALPERISQKVKGQPGKVASSDTKRKKTGHPLTFSLSGLQKEASKRFAMSASDTLKHTQALYEKHTLVTYPRSDCGYLPESQHRQAATIIQALKRMDASIKHIADAADPSIKSKSWNSKKTDAAAHHGIIPTQHVGDLSKLSNDERNIYGLIRKRYLMQFFPEYEYDASTIAIDVAGERFTAKGKVTIVKGWKALIDDSDAPDDPADEVDDSNEADQELPELSAGDPVKIMDTAIAASKTRPPSYYDDGTLIADLASSAKFVEDPVLKSILRESIGIGTEATRAGILDSMIKRGILRRDKRFIKDTNASRSLIAMLPDEITLPEMTARWEQRIDDISKSNSTEAPSGRDQFTADINRFVAEIVDKVKSEFATPPKVTFKQPTREVCFTCKEKSLKKIRRAKDKKIFWVCTIEECDSLFNDDRGRPKAPAPKLEQPADRPPCPECGTDTVLRKAKFGYILGCAKFPECKGYLPATEEGAVIEKKVAPQPEECPDCPICGGTTRLIPTRHGHMFGCTKFRETGCKGAINANADGSVAEEPNSQVAPECPECSGKMVKRRRKIGKKSGQVFWGCAAYPKCTGTQEAGADVVM